MMVVNETPASLRSLLRIWVNAAVVQQAGIDGASVGGNGGELSPRRQTLKGSYTMVETKDQAVEAQQTFFRVTDNVPEEAWYWAALGSIGISAMLKLSGKDDWALFVGQWPPTFLLFGLYHRLIRPSSR